MPASDLRPEIRWLASGFLMTLFSGFGQTYFIALFAAQLKSELSLTEGEFGGLYTVGTLASAAIIGWAGQLADTVPLRWLSVGVVGGLALTSLGMATVSSAAFLGLVFFGLRFFGQGMLTHIAMTAMGRWYNRKRGRAISIAALGLPASEGLLPLLAVAAVGLVGWRQTWIAVALFLAIVAAPLLLALLRRERHPAAAPIPGTGAAGVVQKRQWTRAEVLRSPLFYAVLAAVVAPAFIVTAIFFNQVTLVATKGWTLNWFAATFPILAVAHVLSALATGWFVDRVGARRLPAVFLGALAAASFLLVSVADSAWLPLFMALVGLTLGCSATAQGALWPELFGVEHLGGIRAMATAAIVCASALSPGLVGVLLDAEVSLASQVVGMGLYCLAAAAWMLLLLPRLDRVAATG